MGLLSFTTEEKYQAALHLLQQQLPTEQAARIVGEHYDERMHHAMLKDMESQDFPGDGLPEPQRVGKSPQTRSSTSRDLSLTLRCWALRKITGRDLRDTLAEQPAETLADFIMLHLGWQQPKTRSRKSTLTDG